ncbi:hypothetical protein F5X96DRAFT_672664 [Biscogniauxia mediterranea]|nr:hypothetical protein F5X96DRAFT_672664 [Biscogniauxia mediterranea]
MGHGRALPQMACHGCIDRAISDHQPEVYCDKFKVAARCIMSYKPLAPKRDPDDDDDDDDDEELLGLDGGGHHHDNNNNNGTSSAAAVDEEDEFLPDMYNPEWENEEEDGDNVDWDDEETDS